MFSSFFWGGFECSTHRRPDGRRLDLLETTGHAGNAAEDYRHLRQHGISTIRDGLRWHLIEQHPGCYDWSSFLPMLKAADDSGVQVIWDLCHYGWPEHLDIWSAEFVASFGRFAGETARLLIQKGSKSRLYCPINEISYLAWAGGEVNRMNPCAEHRGAELKAQLVRAAIAAMDAIQNIDPQARFIHAEPLIHLRADPSRGADQREAEVYRQAQWEAWDMLGGRSHPALRGGRQYLDVLGVNFYPHNEWYLHGSTIACGHHDYRPLREMLREVFERYGRPIVIAETGAEGTARPSWLHYVAGEVLAAIEAGVPVLGICLYPILEYPGWENERPCPVGLLGAISHSGGRPVYEPLAHELRRQQLVMKSQNTFVTH